VAKNNKTRFFYVLYSDITLVFDQSERAQGPICIIKCNKEFKIRSSCCLDPTMPGMIRLRRIFSLKMFRWEQSFLLKFARHCPLTLWVIIGI